MAFQVGLGCLCRYFVAFGTKLFCMGQQGAHMGQSAIGLAGHARELASFVATGVKKAD